MERITILAVVQSDLQLIVRLRSVTDLFRAQLSVARNEDEAILYLRGVGIYGNRAIYPLPAVVLFDTESPGACDLNVLAWIREQPEFKKLVAGFLVNDPAHRYQFSGGIDQWSFFVHRDDLAEIAPLLLRAPTQPFQ